MYINTVIPIYYNNKISKHTFANQNMLSMHGGAFFQSAISKIFLVVKVEVIYHVNNMESAMRCDYNCRRVMFKTDNQTLFEGSPII